MTCLEPRPLSKWALTVTCPARKSTCPRQLKRTFFEPWVGVYRLYERDFLKVLYIFPGWLYHFKGLFMTVCQDNWGEWVIFETIPATAHVIFPTWIYNTIHIHSGETSRCCMTSLKLTSLDFKNLWQWLTYSKSMYEGSWLSCSHADAWYFFERIIIQYSKNFWPLVHPVYEEISFLESLFSE